VQVSRRVLAGVQPQLSTVQRFLSTICSIASVRRAADNVTG
jgi:hypothetical protein